MVTIQKRLEKENNVNLNSRIRDVMEAIIAIKDTHGITFLPDGMKNALTNGLDELTDELGLCAYNHFKFNDFEPTPEVIPVMRKVVTIALQKGVL